MAYERRAISRMRFEALVRRALRRLPPEIAARMDNVDVVVRTGPPDSLRRRIGLPPGHDLLGLYIGTSLTQRGEGYNFALPDRIFLFQAAIERAARHEGPAGLERQIRTTVVHEVAHHFGISDARLHEIDRY